MPYHRFSVGDSDRHTVQEGAPPGCGPGAQIEGRVAAAKRSM